MSKKYQTYSCVCVCLARVNQAYDDNILIVWLAHFEVDAKAISNY